MSLLSIILRSSSSFFKSMPALIAAKVAARYIAPVSRKSAPRRRASSRATVLLPLAAGPSIVITTPAICSSNLPLRIRSGLGSGFDHDNACVVNLAGKAYEPASIPEDISDYMLGRVFCKLLCRFKQAFSAPELAGKVGRVNQTVRIEQHAVVVLQFDCSNLIFGFGVNTEHESSSIEICDLAGSYEYGRLVAATAICQDAFFRVNHGVEQRYEFAVLTFAADHSVESFGRFTDELFVVFRVLTCFAGGSKRTGGVGIGSHCSSKTAHHQGGGDAFAHHVAYDHNEPIFGNSKEIVEVTAKVEAWDIGVGDVETGYRRGPLGDHPSLDDACDPHLLGDPRPFNSLGVEPGVCNGHG